MLLILHPLLLSIFLNELKDRQYIVKNNLKTANIYCKKQLKEAQGVAKKSSFFHLQKCLNFSKMDKKNVQFSKVAIFSCKKLCRLP